MSEFLHLLQEHGALVACATIHRYFCGKAPYKCGSRQDNIQSVDQAVFHLPQTLA